MNKKREKKKKRARLLIIIIKCYCFVGHKICVDLRPFNRKIKRRLNYEDLIATLCFVPFLNVASKDICVC